MNNTFEYFAQGCHGIQHDQEVFSKKYGILIFPNLPDSMCSICYNKETFSVDVVENLHSGGKR